MKNWENEYQEGLAWVKEFMENSNKDLLLEAATKEPFKTAIFRFNKTAEEFANKEIPAEFITKGMLAVANDATDDIFEDGAKAVAWYIHKNGKYGDYLNMAFPPQVELYAREHGCTVYQAVARINNPQL